MKSNLAQGTRGIHNTGRTHVKRQDGNSLGVGITAQNCESAINLLGEDHAGEFVWHRERRKRNSVRGASAELGGKTFGVAAEENDFARATVAEIAEPARELLRRKLFPRSIEQHDCCARVDFQLTQSGGRGGAEFADFDIGVMANAANVIIQQSTDFRAAGFPEHKNANFHESGCQSAAEIAEIAVRSGRTSCVSRAE